MRRFATGRASAGWIDRERLHTTFAKNGPGVQRWRQGCSEEERLPAAFANEVTRRYMGGEPGTKKSRGSGSCLCHFGRRSGPKEGAETDLAKTRTAATTTFCQLVTKALLSARHCDDERSHEQARTSPPMLRRITLFEINGAAGDHGRSK